MLVCMLMSLVKTSLKTLNCLTTKSVFPLLRILFRLASDDLHKTLVDVGFAISATHWFHHRWTVVLWTHTCGCPIRSVMTYRVDWTLLDAAPSLWKKQNRECFSYSITNLSKINDIDARKKLAVL